LRPKVQPPTPPAPQVAKKDTADFADQITALLSKDKQPPQPQAQPQPQQPAQPAPQAATQGLQNAAIDTKLSADARAALQARLIGCWNVPVGWTDPAEVRVVLMINVTPDGGLAGDPVVSEKPSGRYSQLAAESAVRAVRKCAPFTELLSAKFGSPQQMRVIFDPKEMSGG
jgi:colicin import membrane protein